MKDSGSRFVHWLLIGALGLASVAAGPVQTGSDAGAADRTSTDMPSSTTLADLCHGVGGTGWLCEELDGSPLRAEEFPGVRTVPDPACPDDYVGPAGLIVDPYPFEFSPEEHLGEGGEPAAPEVEEQLPSRVDLRGSQATFTHDRIFVAHDGRIYTRAKNPTSQEERTWQQVLLPRCLDGTVTEVSADGFVLLATNAERETYTLDYGHGKGWTRRWGAVFWTDLGARIPSDVTDWDLSELHSSFDEYFVDRAGNKQGFWGILMLYMLRGDGTRITYYDPWLPVDQSREMCPPKRGTVRMAGLSASGSTAMVVTTEGHIYTRLWDFDISGANTVLHDYAWHDQDDVEDPLIQLPAPDWIRHPDVPGTITDHVSIRKVSPGTEHRVMRIEGADEHGKTGYWEKDISEVEEERRGGPPADRRQPPRRPSTPADEHPERVDSPWQFLETGKPLVGEPLPAAGPHELPPEDYKYTGVVDGNPATIRSFNPYCSPTTLEIEFSEDTLELVLHSVDGLRQERRSRGLDLYPRHYRSALEVPRDTWERRNELANDVQGFLNTHFEQRFLDGPLNATLAHLELQEPCWTFTRTPTDLSGALTQPPLPDAGTVAAESRVMSEAVPQIVRGDPDLEALLAATQEDDTFGTGIRACPPSTS